MTGTGDVSRRVDTAEKEALGLSLDIPLFPQENSDGPHRVPSGYLPVSGPGPGVPSFSSGVPPPSFPWTEPLRRSVRRRRTPPHSSRVSTPVSLHPRSLDPTPHPPTFTDLSGPTNPVTSTFPLRSGPSGSREHVSLGSGVPSGSRESHQLPRRIQQGC